MDSEGKFRYIAFDAVEIDLVSRRVTVAGVETALEPKAFDVLALLARTPDKAFTRDEILDAVWGHRHITPSVLNRVILLIRHALGDSARGLHTLRGIGYRFGGEVRFFARHEKTGAIVHVAGDALSADAPAQNTAEPPGVPASPAQAAASTAPVESRSRRAGDRATPRRSAHAALVLLPLLAVLVFAGWKLWSRTQPGVVADTAPMSVKGQSIAVLPLVNAGGEADQQFFSDAISENLITTLSQFEGLKVIGRGSSFRFRDGKEDSKTIGAKLGVTHLVEGSVQRADDNVRIGIQLVRTIDGSTVWTQRFDRPYHDLFALQDEIALAVAGALQVRLLHAMPGAVETGRPASGNLEAYNAYLRGTYYMTGGKEVAKAIERFAEATRIDPDYAQAWSWLGFMRTQYARGDRDADAARASYAQARNEIDTALRLEPNFGQAHAIRANLLGSADHDWNGALAEFRIALSLAPDNDPSHGAVSRLLATLGRVNEAIIERRKYIEGDPLAGFAHIYLAQLLASLGRLEEAETSLRDATKLDPDPGARDWLASERSYLAVLRGDAVIARTEAESMAPGRWRERTLTLALQIGNDRAAADAALQHLTDTDGQAKNDAYATARAHALRGDADKTFEWLQRDRERGDSGVHHALFDPLLLRFRDDPRFAEYCRKANLPPPSASEALGIDRIRAANIAKR
ncbi:winged helix-turn-helix domain-containing protein [Rudaea sp.]|uniref:winged helix-turn-helix domain-containing tetratricopeptide repeat protein n=1 Tax=Rudaea sp. TaxID=2136325 RepID=UPI00321F6E34